MNNLPRFKVVISPAAEFDLDDISDYLIAQGADQAARRLVATMLDCILALAILPDRGAVPKELECASVRRFRQFVGGPYRVVYHVGSTRVTVMLVADGRRDMKRLLAERLLGAEPSET